MLINLSDKITDGIKSIADTNITYDPFDFYGETVKIEKGVHVILNLVKGDGQNVHLNGSLNTLLQLSCSRCNAPLDYSLNVEFSKMISNKDFDDSKESDDEFEGILQGELLDVKALVLNEILLNFPMKVLCMPTCKGLCSKCGVNQNEASCTCDQEDIDPRWLGLKSLYEERFKEV